MSGFVHSWITGLVIMLGCPLSAFSTVGWETGDMVLDFGLNLESGESTVLVDKSEVGEPFFVELTWKLNPRNCLKQIHTLRGGEGGPATTKAVDDGLFNGVIFFPHEVTIEPGQKVVWIYADGAKEPHSVTSGGCRVNDCSGGGKKFNSGLILNKLGHRFEHVFKHPGTFPYHCDLHLGSM